MESIIKECPMKLFFGIFAMLSILVNGSYANEVQGENIYISPSQVLIGQNGIFVKYDDTVFAVPSIACDAQGIYINSTLRASDADNDIYWFCDWCDVQNSTSTDRCWRCGSPRESGYERHTRDD